MRKENIGGDGLSRGKGTSDTRANNDRPNKPASSHMKPIAATVFIILALLGGAAGFLAYSFLPAPPATETAGDSTQQGAGSDAARGDAPSSTETETSSTRNENGAPSATDGSTAGSKTEGSVGSVGGASGNEGAKTAATIAAAVFSSNDSGNNRTFYASISSSTPAEFRGGDNIAWSAWKSGGDMAFLNENIERVDVVFGEPAFSEEGGYTVASTPVSYTKRYTQTQTAGEELKPEHIEATLVVKTDSNGKIVYMAEKR